MTNLTANQMALLQEWNSAKEALVKATEKERELKERIFGEIVSYDENDISRSGTENIELGNNFVLKTIFGIDLKIEDENKLSQALKVLEQTGEVGTMIAERLVNYKASISKKEYDLLPPEHRKIINRAVSIKTKKPVISIVDKSKKGNV